MKHSVRKKAAPKRSFLKSGRAAVIAEMILSLITIPLALGYVTNEYEARLSTKELRIILCAVFFVMAFTRLFRARRFRLDGKPKLKMIMQWAYALVFLVCSFLPVFIGYKTDVGMITDTEKLKFEFSGDVRQIIAVIFWGIILIGRVVSIIRDHRWRRIVINVLLIVLITVLALLLFVAHDLMIAMIVIVILALGSIFSVVFGRLRTDVLRRIIRKTYASEVILGLLLLVFAFSYVLEFTDSETIPTFLDGLWYCFAIVTTIGFGDITATSLVGRLLSIILGIYGIIVVSLITSIIVNFYGEMRREPEEDVERLPEEAE